MNILIVDDEPDVRKSLSNFLKKLGHNVFSEEMRQVVCQAEKYSADRSVPLLIEGESGTGKELIARYTHHFNQQNSTRPFVAINCGAFASELIEAELFGHEAGAFTGASKNFLLDFIWPGNVRQLKNAMERLAILKMHGQVGVDDLSFIKDFVADNVCVESSKPVLGEDFF